MPKRKRGNRLHNNNWQLTIGLTGGFGSGKSTVLKEFKKHGAYTIDSDKIVHQLSKTNEVRKEILSRFGTNILSKSGGIDKKRFSSLIFSSDQQRKKLEKIIHPRVAQIIKEKLRSKTGVLAICDIPLLFEVGWNHWFDSVVVVNASRNTIVKRLRAKGFCVDEIKSRFKAQWPLARKRAAADFVIENGSSLKKTRQNIKRIIDRLSHRGGLLD